MANQDLSATTLSHDDRLLMERLRAGDGRAVAAIERRYGDELRLFCRRMLGDPSRAEDVVQDVLERCCRLEAESLPANSIRGWLYQVARRRCIDTRRKQHDEARPEARAARGVQRSFDHAIDPLTTPAGKALKRDRAIPYPGRAGGARRRSAQCDHHALFPGPAARGDCRSDRPVAGRRESPAQQGNGRLARQAETIRRFHAVMTCETVSELLLDYVEGELSPEQSEAVRSHLADCRACATRCRETRALVGDLAAARSADAGGSDVSFDASPPLAPAAVKTHTQIGDFEILEELGRGGMGVVYRARQLSLNRTVALKLLSGALVQTDRSITRFTREAQAAARLHHTNIVPVYAQGRAGEYFYYAMELIEGPSLDKFLRQQREAAGGISPADARPGAHSQTTRRLSTPTRLLRSAASVIRRTSTRHHSAAPPDYRRVVRWVAGVAEGLHHAHEQGVIHRDIKAQNLLLGPDDELHITDFGLARILDEPGLTHSSEVVGTPAYMAPEQITGGRAAIDRRTDVYALGVTLYELLTLHRPFETETYDQTIHQILTRDPTPPRRIAPHTPADLETICLRALEKEPHRRFPTAAEMARDLRRWAEGFPIFSRPLGPIGRTIRWVRRHPWRSLAAAATALLLIVIPLGAASVRANANRDIETSFSILLDDYREKDRALAQLGWVSRIGGDSYRRRFVEAFANIRTDPRRTIEMAEAAVAERPDDPDARYLLAWAYARRMSTQGTATWADAQAQLAAGDALRERGIEPSPAGYFFRGQAVWGSDPREAVQTFELAINKASEQERGIFTQAMPASVAGDEPDHVLVARPRLLPDGRIEAAFSRRRPAAKSLSTLSALAGPSGWPRRSTRRKAGRESRKRPMPPASAPPATPRSSRLPAPAVTPPKLATTKAAANFGRRSSRGTGSTRRPSIRTTPTAPSVSNTRCACTSGWVIMPAPGTCAIDATAIDAGTAAKDCTTPTTAFYHALIRRQCRRHGCGQGGAGLGSQPGKRSPGAPAAAGRRLSAYRPDTSVRPVLARDGGHLQTIALGGRQTGCACSSAIRATPPTGRPSRTPPGRALNGPTTHGCAWRRRTSTAGSTNSLPAGARPRSAP